MEQNSPQLAGTITMLPWVQDGIDESEVEDVQELVHLATFGPEAFGAIVDAGWATDGMSEAEVSVVDILTLTSSEERLDLARAIASLSWVMDDVTDDEAAAAVALGRIGQYSAELADSVLQLPWVLDVIDATESKVIQELRWTAKESPEFAIGIASLPWIADGANELEASVITDLKWMWRYSADVASVTVTLPWISGDLGTSESKLIQRLKWMAEDHPDQALQIARMPFLMSLDPADHEAMASLSRLSSFRPDSFLRIMEHPTISEGITDDWAMVVATLYGVDRSNPQLIEALLDAEGVTLEERLIELPYAGEVQMAIIRLGPGAGRSMDLLEHAVRGAEAFMDSTFPTNYVALLFGDGVTESFAGTNFGTHMAILPEYDVDDESYEAQYAGYIVAHEVAHYYWSGNANWLDEGAAELMAILSENARVGSPLDPDNYPCSHAPNIATLERLGTSSRDGALSAFRCNYSLGERLFLDLHRSLEEDEFKQGFRSLYEVSKVSDEDETTEGISLGIVALREAFGSAASTPVVTARWYEGTERFDRSRLDKGRVDPELPSINGSFTLVGVALSYDNCLKNKRELNFSVREIPDRVTVCLKYTYDVDSPQQADIDIVVWFEDGFPLQRISRTIEAMEGYIGAQWPAYIGPTQWNWWAPGRYYVYVYHEGVKVGEAQFIVLP